MNLSSDTPKKQSGQFYLVILIVLASAMVGVGWFYFRDMDAPTVSVEAEQDVVGKASTLTVRASDGASGIKALTVVATKNSATITLLEKTYAGKPGEVVETVSLESLELPDGVFKVMAKADDGAYFNFGEGNRGHREVSFTFDTTPPVIAVQSGTVYVKRGGTGVVSYKLSEAVSMTGVRVGELFFPGYLQDDGSYLCYYAFPYFTSVAEFVPAVSATDQAGNERERRFSLRPKNHVFKKDIIRLPDSFLNRKMPDFEGHFPGDMSPLVRFLKVNRELRKANRAALLSIGRTTTPTPQWEGAFQRMKGAPRAGFGDQRSYVYAGKEVDKQTHLGVDIASLKHYPVPAANRGTVVFAGDMGIYGGCVIIDHGLGLQTLYAHLSSIGVKEGEQADKGRIIGKTGMTGLAGGDHLHFGVLVSGLPVSPVEWWDAGWIRDNITSKID